jgi:hypothetical protein
MPRLLCVQGEYGVIYPRNLAQRIASRRHFLGSKPNQAEGVFEEGQRLYREQRFSEAGERWGRAALQQLAPSHAHVSSVLFEGRAGVAVTRVSHRLTSKDRDTLYEGNINPIAQFPAEGIVIFGQKTLQVTPSALDRINVRRMLIYVKREISRIAATLLFDQNVDATWARFTGQVNPFLASIKSRLGLTDYRVILDSTTTTPDLVDRNILYAKVFLKPARAIEFIAIDFTITDSGASFAD